MWIQWIPIRIRIRIRKTAGDPKTNGSCGSESATLVVANTFTHLDSTGKGGGRVGGGGEGIGLSKFSMHPLKTCFV